MEVGIDEIVEIAGDVLIDEVEKQGGIDGFALEARFKMQV